MPNDMSSRIGEVANAVDLRRVGSHPDYWYPICWADELKQGKMLARRFAGEPIVVYRGKSGQVFAMEDRCAHRQVPLHLGVVKGDGIKCGYHGWKYDKGGACIDVPYLGMAHDRVPNGVKTYPCREIEGLVFVFPGDASLAEQRLPSGLASAMNNKVYKTRRLNREVSCHYSFMHENLFDMNHQFLHRKQMGTIKAKCLGRDNGPDWAEVRYTFSRTEGSGTVGETAILGVVRGKDGGDFTDLMVIRTEYPYQNLKVFVGGGEPVLDVWLGYLPLDKEQRTNRTFGYLSVKRPGIPGLIDIAWPFITKFTEAIFQEDRDIVEFEQAAHDAQGSDWNNEIFPPIRDLRAVLARCGVPMDAPVADLGPSVQAAE